MELHRGRLIDHVHLRVSDLDRSKAFYRAILASLGKEIQNESDWFFYSDELFVSNDKQATTGLHLAFQVESREAITRFHEAGLKAGGTDNGKPGERAHYHPGYYSAYVLDPDGNNIEAVFHGPVECSAESVVMRPLEYPEE